MADNAPLTVLTYHAVDDRGDVIAVSPDLFRRQMQLLADNGMQGIGLNAAFGHLERENTFPPESVVLTFDDSYQSVFEAALPVLREQGFGGTVFVPTACVGFNAEASRQVNAHLDRDMMSWDQLGHLADSGIEIAAHTRTHPDLTKLSDQRLEEELAGCRFELERHIHGPVVSFAYPYGYHNRRVRQAASRHFHYACTTALGHHPASADPLVIRRLDVYYLENEHTLLRAARGGLKTWWALRQAIRDVRRSLQPGVS